MFSLESNKIIHYPLDYGDFLVLITPIAYSNKKMSHTYIHNWSSQPFRPDYELVPYVLFVNLYMKV